MKLAQFVTVRAIQLSKWFGESSHGSTGMYYKSMVEEYKINATIVIAALVSRYLYQRLRTLSANSLFFYLLTNYSLFFGFSQTNQVLISSPSPVPQAHLCYGKIKPARANS